MPALLQPGPPWRLEGEVSAAEPQPFAALSAWQPAEPTLDLGELELLDGVSVARAATAVDELLLRLGRLTLLHAPQHLAHTLYKVGRLGHPGLVLVDPRQDEQEFGG